MGSCWVINADETVAFTFLLLATELAVSRGAWIYLPFAAGLLGLVSVFHFYLGAILFCGYLAIRHFEQQAEERQNGLWHWLAILGAAVLGVGLAAGVWLPSLHSILNSPRGSGLIPNFAFGSSPAQIFQVASPLYYFTAALRPFANDLLGTGDKFLGWENYFEAPITYCGILPILMLPQAFIGARRGQRLLYILFLCAIIIPVVFPWFRYLFWAFRGGYFRAFSLFSVFGVITLSTTVFSNYTARGRLNLFVLAGTVVALSAFLFLPIRQMQSLIDPGLRLLVIAFMGLFAAILVTGQLLNRQSVAAWLIVGTAAVSVVYFNGPTVNRPTVSKDELNQRTGYNDATVDAIRDVKSYDHGFFRVTKMWGSGPANRISYNDALIFGYYGTPCYSSFNNIDYIKFLIAVGAIPPDNIPTDAQWSPGLIWEPLLSTFACEKYAITTEPQRFMGADHYEFLKQYDDVFLFRNSAFMPFGLVLEQHLAEHLFLEMPTWAKAQALLHVVILGDQAQSSGIKVPSATLEEVKGHLRDVPIKDALSQRRTKAFQLTQFRDTEFEGSVKLDRPGVLVFQMPFDSGWQATVNHKPAQPHRADVGLLGLELNAGEQVVHLRYVPPLLYTGASVSLISFAVFLIGAWKTRGHIRFARQKD